MDPAIPFDTVFVTGLDKTLFTGVVTFLDTTPETQTEKVLVTTFATSSVTLNATKLNTVLGTCNATELDTNKATTFATKPGMVIITESSSVSDTHADTTPETAFGRLLGKPSGRTKESARIRAAFVAASPVTSMPTYITTIRVLPDAA
jgi:hypothetical protein